MKEAKLEVRLISHTPNPEHLIADAARLCYADDEQVEKLFDKKIESIDDARMIKILVQMQHMSPLEHASYSFFVRGVSRAMTHQLVRHRIASYSQRSQRYVTHKDFEFIIPHTIKEAGMTAKYTEMMKQIGKFYEELSDGLEEELALKGEARNQDARYILPNSCETKIIMTMNARELLHFFHERLCNRAQWEIREASEKMLELAYPTAPNIFSYAGPACVSEGKCYQRKKGCGFPDDKKEYFQNLKEIHNQK